MEAQPCRTDGSISPRLFTFGIDEADAKVRALAIGKEVMYAEEPEKEEDEYGTFWFE